MGSRIRENVKHLFQCFCEVVQPQPPDKHPWIIQKFPESYHDEEILKSVPKFAYPCELRTTFIQHYSFVLTSIDSKWTFGFCRHDPKTETALVFLSFLPWHETFKKLLDIVGEMVISSKSGAEPLWTFLDAIYNSPVPEQGALLQVPYNHGLSNFICEAPNHLSLPKVPENINLTEYFSAVDSTNMMIIFASMLHERRIVFLSTRLSRLSACVQAANAIIYPMNWQHIFIPVLPLSLIDYLLAPMPFLIGVPTSTFKRVRRSDMGDVVILDADSNTVESPFNDLESLPEDVVSYLKDELKNASLGDVVSRAFLQALVKLIGGYRDALRFHQGERITFNADAFVESRSPKMQPFLRKMLQLQIFQQFIEERLDMLNAGLGFSDEFELAACSYSEKTSGKLKQQYKEWLSTVRKEGTAFFKSVKSKANPAVKSAVKSVKGIRSKFQEFPREHSGVPEKDSTTHKERPISPQNSPPPKKRPTTLSPFIKLSPTAAAVTYRKDPSFSSRKPTMQEQRSNYSVLSPGETSCGSTSPQGCSTPGLQLSPIDTDLMGDLQEVIFRKCSSLMNERREGFPLPPVDRTLKPVRSMESFGSRCYVGAGTGTLNLHPQGSPSGASSFRQGASSTFEHSSSHAPANSFASQKLECQQMPLAYNSSKIDMNTFTPSPDDAFASFAQIPVGKRPTASLTSAVNCAPTMPLATVPTRPTRSVKVLQNSIDLIKLDSTPSIEDFDPLLSSNASSTSQSNFSGLSNPLYPYCMPQSNNLQGNSSFLYPTNVMSSVSHNISPMPSQIKNDFQDSELLKEYGLDFNSLSLRNGGSSLSPNGNVLKPLVTDPFEEVERLAKDTQQHHLNTSQSMWTKFE